MGIPAFEIVDLKDTANFFLEYEHFETIVLPDFTGDRVASYLQLKDIVCYFKYLSQSFPAI